MIDRDKENEDGYKRLDQFSVRLANLGVRMFDRKYFAEAFGSWFIAAGTERRLFIFEYEGKEGYLRYHDASVEPRDHRDFIEHKFFATWRGEDPLAYVEEVLRREFGL